LGISLSPDSPTMRAASATC
jgi:hypothetical protein